MKKSLGILLTAGIFLCSGCTLFSEKKFEPLALKENFQDGVLWLNFGNDFLNVEKIISGDTFLIWQTKKHEATVTLSKGYKVLARNADWLLVQRNTGCLTAFLVTNNSDTKEDKEQKEQLLKNVMAFYYHLQETAKKADVDFSPPQLQKLLNDFYQEQLR